MSVAEAAAMREAKVGAIMVRDGPQFVGIFTEREQRAKVMG